MAGFVPGWEFDFKVSVLTHIVAVKPGQSVNVPVLVETLEGEPRSIRLTTGGGGAGGLSANVIPSTVQSGGTATLFVAVPADASPGRYQFTVRGEPEGTTFKTSNDTLTVIVGPKEKKGDGEDQGEPKKGGPGKKPPKAPPSVKARPVIPRYAKPPRIGYRPTPARWLGPLILATLVLAAVAPAVWRSGLLQPLLGSVALPGGPVSVGTTTYVGSSTFCIVSIIGNPPECATSNDAAVQIDGNGDVLGPVLFGKITGSSFTGEAHTQSGETFPMTGTFSNGVLTAQHRSIPSGSVTWTITLHRR